MVLFSQIMIIKHLALKNFRKYTLLEVDLPEGVIGVIGNNGSGKSTFLEAIAWILYGSVGLKTKNEQIFPDFLDNPGTSEGLLRLLMNGAEYTVERSFKIPNKSTATLYVGETMVATGTREVTDEIVKITGMDYKAFQTSFYTRQNELNLLGSLQAAERSRRLEEMLGLQKTNIIINSIKGDKKVLDGKVQEIDRTIARDGEFRDQLKEAESGLENLAKALQGIEKEQTALSEREESDKRAFKILEERKDKFTDLSSRLELEKQKFDSNQKRIKTLQAEIEDIEKSAERFRELTEKVKKLPEIQAQYEQLANDQTAYHSRISKLRQLEQYKTELEDLTARGKELGGLDKECTKLIEDIGIINNNIREAETELNARKEILNDLKLRRSRDFTDLEKLKKQIEDIRSMGPEAECSFCHRPFKGDMQSILKHFGAEIGTLETAVAEHDDNIQKASDVISEMQNLCDQAGAQKLKLDKRYIELSPVRGELEGLRKQYKLNRDKIAVLEEELRELGTVAFDPEQFEQIRRELSQLLKENEEYQRLSERMSGLEKDKGELRELSNANNIINNNITELQEKLTGLDFSPEAYNLARSKLEDLSARVRSGEKQLNEARQNKAVLSAKIDGIKDKLQLVEEARQRGRELVNDKIYMDALIEIVRDLKTELASRIRPALIKYSSDLMDSMSDGKFNEINLDENYDIFIRDYGEFCELKRFSGGEQDLANLSLRLAISKYIARNSRLEAGFLILDEVFGSQDTFRKENILNAIANLQDFFQQIFIVTHVDEIKEAVSTLFTVQENSDGSSSINFE